MKLKHSVVKTWFAPSPWWSIEMMNLQSLTWWLAWETENARPTPPHFIRCRKSAAEMEICSSMPRSFSSTSPSSARLIASSFSFLAACFWVFIVSFSIFSATSASVGGRVKATIASGLPLSLGVEVVVGVLPVDPLFELLFKHLSTKFLPLGEICKNGSSMSMDSSPCGTSIAWCSIKRVASVSFEATGQSQAAQHKGDFTAMSVGCRATQGTK